MALPAGLRALDHRDFRLFFLIARYGLAIAFLLNAASFLAVIAALFAMKSDGRPRPDRATTIRGEIADGLRYAAGSPVVSLVLSLVLAVSLFEESGA